jgi:hypothetical protein
MRKRHSLLASALFLVLLGIAGPAPAVKPAATSLAAMQVAAEVLAPLPNQAESFKFAVLGDFGTGSKQQYELAGRMATLHKDFKYELVALVGDNLYGSQKPQDFKKKFEIPYKPLLDAGVKFYASLGNHDKREQRSYNLFNMDGKLYYSFTPKPNVRFFALDSGYPVPEQIKWLERELAASNDDWKIVFFHHPLYSSGDRHGSDVRLREVLEPLFLKHNVSLVLNGHDHFYERVKPQKGIAYFIVGSGGKLRKGNIERKSGLTAKGFDTDLAFMAAEIIGDDLYFNAISRLGKIVDSGKFTRRKIMP